ncbi:MAG: NAD(P)-dependent oxidoreductase [Nibricoccus sp.]
MNTLRDLILVTGSAGWIGRRVSCRLSEKGCLVVGYDMVGSTGPWIEVFEGELALLGNPTPDLRRLLQKTKTVIHCAGRAHRPVETPEEVQAFKEANVRGTQNLVNACLQNGVDRIVYVSTIAGYDWKRAVGQPVSEDVLIKPVSAYAQTKLEGESIISKSSLDWRVIRLATVFGEGDRANFAKLARGLKRRQFLVPGDGDARKSVIPVDVAVEVLVEMALKTTPRYRLINAAITDTPTLREMCEAYSKYCGFPRPISLPMSVFKVLSAGGTVINRVINGFPLTLDTLGKLTTSTVIDNSRMLETLPDIPLPNFVEALARHATFYKNI